MASFYIIHVVFPHPETKKPIITYFEKMSQKGTDLELSVNPDDAKAFTYEKAKMVARYLETKVSATCTPVFHHYKD